MSLPHFLTEKPKTIGGVPPYEMINERQDLHPQMRGKIRLLDVCFGAHSGR